MGVNITGISSDQRGIIMQKMAAGVAKKEAGEAASQTLADVIDKIEKGADVTYSSGASLLSKIGNGKTDRASLAEIISNSTNFTSTVALSEKIDNFLEHVNALLGQEGDSLFLKNKPTTQEALESFDITCLKDGTSFSLEVKQLATAQKNETEKLDVEEPCGLSVGRHFFTLRIDGEVTALMVRVTQQDTQKTMLHKVADAINQAGRAVIATVQEEGDKAFVSIECTGTGAPVEGEESVFSFSQSGEENIVDYLNLNQIVVTGQDAVFNFNNAEEDTTYMYNSALIDESVSVDFKKVTDGAVNVSFTYDYDKLSEQVETFVKEYNMLKQEISSGTYATVKNYFKQVTELTKTYKDDLVNIGISIGTEGEMKYNSGMLYATSMKELAATLNKTQDCYSAKVKEVLDNLQNYMKRLTGKTKKYYGLRAKKSNAALRAMLNNV